MQSEPGGGNSARLFLCLYAWLCDAQAADDRGKGGKCACGEERKVITILPGKVEHQGDQCRTGALPQQARGTQHATGSSTAVARCGGDNGVVVRRLEQAKTGTAEDHTPDNIQIRRLRGKQRQRKQTRRHDRQSQRAQ